MQQTHKPYQGTWLDDNVNPGKYGSFSSQKVPEMETLPVNKSKLEKPGTNSGKDFDEDAVVVQSYYLSLVWRGSKCRYIII